MKKKMNALIAVAVVVDLGLATGAFAQGGMGRGGGGGWGPGTPYGRMYNPQTVETVTGEVLSVDTVTPMKGMSSGVHLTLKTAKETIGVHLGPAWYLDNQDVKIASKAKIEVTGSRITFEGKPTLIAAKVKEGDQVLTLRDAKGFPVWAGGRR